MYKEIYLKKQKGQISEHSLLIGVVVGRLFGKRQAKRAEWRSNYNRGDLPKL